MNLQPTSDIMRSLNALALLTIVAAAPLAAQAYNYPALQTPRIVDREYNFAAATGGNAGTSLIFQWREGLSDDWQLTLEGGLATPKSPPLVKLDTRLLVGAGVAWQWVRATADLPLDLAVTGETGLWSGNGQTVIRIPVGVSAGHTFVLDNSSELTPFVHPRLSLDNDNCRACGGTTTKLDVDIDIGLNYEITPQLGVRVAALLGGASYAGSTNAIGFSLAWTPKGLKKF
jgi:hypothetical protein